MIVPHCVSCSPCHCVGSSPGGTCVVVERKLLLVDDNAVFRQILAAFLRRRGFEVEEAVDGLDALRILASSRPNLVVSDCQMPGMTGPELVQELHRVEPSLPVILVSGASSSDKSGAIAFFEKTNSIATLAERVDRIWESLIDEKSRDLPTPDVPETESTQEQEKDRGCSPDPSSGP